MMQGLGLSSSHIVSSLAAAAVADRVPVFAAGGIAVIVGACGAAAAGVAADREDAHIEPQMLEH